MNALPVIILSTFLFQPKLIHLTCDDLLRFNPTTIQVKAGEVITIRLHNSGKIPSLMHNFVLLKENTMIARFGNAAMQSADEGYIPSSEQASVIAHTAMTHSGKQTEVTFKVPEPGTYTFICSYPGHYSISQGKLISQ